MLEDTATWENKGGDRNLTGFIKGFEVVPYPYLTEFPKEYIKQKEEEIYLVYILVKHYLVWIKKEIIFLIMKNQWTY